MPELSYHYDGTREGAIKAVKGNIESIKAVFVQLDEGDLLAIVKDVYKEEGNANE